MGLHEKPKVWAHRGASGSMPENTMPSFRRAVEEGADGIELDIQLTKDGEIVVCHDERIDRTSNGTGFVRDYTLAELRRFNFNRTHPDTAHADIPTMREVFEFLRPTDLAVNIELKTGKFDYDGIEEKILAMARETGMEDRVIYSSFNHYTIRRIRELCPTAKTGLLFGDGFVDVPAYGEQQGVQALHPSLSCLRYPGFLESCRARGLDVNVWTVNKKRDVRVCAEAGVHAVITNYPARTRRVLDGIDRSNTFQQLVESEIEPWLEACVRSHDIFNSDGLRLRVYSAVNPEERASIVMIHGFCEFFGKFHELAWRLYQEGYSIFFTELRGHGDSEREPLPADGRNSARASSARGSAARRDPARKAPAADSRVYVRDLDDYVTDVEDSIRQVVRAEAKTDHLDLFAHSLGGCVGALLLEKYPDVFRCAVLSSPMFRIDCRGLPKPVVAMLRLYSDVVKNDGSYAPKQGPFPGRPDFKNSSAMDRDRYMYQFSQRIENPAYQTWGGTWAWVKASMDGGKRAVRAAGRVKTPVLVLQAGSDDMVDNGGQNDFVRRAKNAELIAYPGARHELYNATDEIREKWFADLCRFYRQYD